MTVDFAEPWTWAGIAALLALYWAIRWLRWVTCEDCHAVIPRGDYAHRTWHLETQRRMEAVSFTRLIEDNVLMENELRWRREAERDLAYRESILRAERQKIFDLASEPRSGQ